MIPRGRSAVFGVLVGTAVLLLIGGLSLSSGSTVTVDEFGRLVLSLGVILTAAMLGGHIAVRFGQPAVLGELIGGMVLGNLPGLRILQFMGTDPYLDVVARLGMLLLLFEVGLDMSVRDLFAVGPSSIAVAAVGTAASFALGALAAAILMPQSSTAVHVFVGAAITATSVGITARVLKDMGASRSGEAKVILGAAIVDDVLALVVLGAVVAWIGTSQSTVAWNPVPIVALIMKTAGFLVLALVLGTRLTPTWFRRAAGLRTESALLTVGLCFCFLLSWAASAIGLAALVGAFAAGLVLEDTHSAVFVQRGERSLAELLRPMTSFLVPVFFVLVGFRTSMAVFASPALVTLAVALTLAAILGKLACAMGVLNPGVSRLTVAVGMIPRGEVALVFAALGSTLMISGAPLLDGGSYTAVVTVVILTTLVTPSALKWSAARASRSASAPRPAA